VKLSSRVRGITIYFIKKSQVIKESHRKYYSWSTNSYTYSGIENIVYFDDVKKVVKAHVLKYDDSLNYSYSKIPNSQD